MIIRNLCLIAVAALFSHAETGSAQSPFGQAQGSRPGETYRTGQAAPQNSSQAPYQTGAAAATDPAPARPATSRQSHAAGTPVIMEFSDLQCPDSARYNRDLKQQVLQRYVSSGRAAYEWHDFPLPVHPQAPEAAAAARCAGSAADQMRQQIMANQGQMNASTYAGYARQMGIHGRSFSSCMEKGASAAAVQRDRQLGQSLGVRGTPTLVLGIADGKGNVRPAKVVKAYNPPQQVLGEIDAFLASAGAPRQQAHR